jgi:hypothetical protein
VRIFHNVKLVIDLVNAESIVIEAGCYLLSVGRKDIFNVLDSDPDLMPCLDYERVVGLEEWVPTYTKDDNFLKNIDKGACVIPSTSESGLKINTKDFNKISINNTASSNTTPEYDIAVSHPTTTSDEDPIFDPYRVAPNGVEAPRNLIELFPPLQPPTFYSFSQIEPDDSSPHGQLNELLSQAMIDPLL